MNTLNEMTKDYITAFKEDITIYDTYIKEEVLEVKIENKAFNKLVLIYIKAFESYVIFSDIDNKKDEDLIEDLNKYFSQLRKLFSEFKKTKKVITEKAKIYKTIEDIYKLNALIIAIRFIMNDRLYKIGLVPYSSYELIEEKFKESI